jgi:hypothetical protein
LDFTNSAEYRSKATMPVNVVGSTHQSCGGGLHHLMQPIPFGARLGSVRGEFIKLGASSFEFRPRGLVTLDRAKDRIVLERSREFGHSKRRRSGDAGEQATS